MAAAMRDSLMPEEWRETVSRMRSALRTERYGAADSYVSATVSPCMGRTWIAGLIVTITAKPPHAPGCWTTVRPAGQERATLAHAGGIPVSARGRTAKGRCAVVAYRPFAVGPGVRGPR
ncbi:hypothetical protein Sgou_17890 [Streptomyces gougerotii]|uniref:Uncharacterized protein n=1 Tax=Streptomyces gougerotii TaxID=53448 RepID=A0A8H9HI75_9ACTN|nr:hypothetical protein Sgou_17890 [Streptomyces gougerotii]GGU67176.1 hypothetical protein GCM10010227_21190 [Streptomyces gougerotii]